MSSKFWWQDRPWRIVQTNMREIDMRDISAKQYVADMKAFNANTAIINTGGIVASYDTKFPFHFTNEYLTGDSLKEIIKACQNEGIRVFSRVDFSKVRKPVYENHPDWAYVSPKGNIIDYYGDIHVCFNSEYQQNHAISIMREIIQELNPDGIFMNMGGYFVAYDYTNGWQGICQCENCQKRFYEMFGEKLPTQENEDDPVFQKYMIFQQKTTKEYYDNINKMFAEEKPDICFVPQGNMLRGEAGTFLGNAKQNYHYKASEIIKTEKNSYPDKVASATSVDFIDMIYRYSAVSPYQQGLRVMQSLANGGTADYYMVGRLDTHRDKSGYKELQRMFKYHKDNEEDYVGIETNAKIALIKPIGGLHNLLTMENLKEYIGWFNLLSEHHYVFDCLEDTVLEQCSLDKYNFLILPDVSQLNENTAKKLDKFVQDGGTLLCIGTTGFFDERNNRYLNAIIKSLGIKRIGKITSNILSAYFQFPSKEGFSRFEETDLVYLHNTYIYADYEDSAKKYLKLIPPHRFAPAESAYHTNVTDYPAFTINTYGKGRAVYLPWYPGDEFQQFGFPNMDNFMADLLENILEYKPIESNAPAAVEITWNRKNDGSARYIHLVNGTGYFNLSYFKPTDLYALYVAVPFDKKPVSVTSMVTGNSCKYELKNEKLYIYLDKVGSFEALKIV
ncbi:MAG: beta-galactosidase trimerization domain-containing protein [Sphaerochaetaceae bacterium]